MIECRQKQDRVNDILLSLNREYSGVRRAARSAKAAVEIAKDPEKTALRTQLSDLEAQDDDLRFLGEVIKSKLSNLKMTSSDIRLLCSIVEQQIKSGEVRPERPGQKSMDTSKIQENTPLERDEQKSPTDKSQDNQSKTELVDSNGDKPVLSIEDFLGESPSN